MSVDTTAIENALRAWVAALITPVEVIFAHPNAPRPDKSYVTIKINGIETAGHDDESQPDAAELRTIKGPRIIVVEFQAFGDDSLTLLDKIKSSSEKNSTSELLLVDNISVLSQGNISDITIALETDFERRGVLEIRFAIGSSETDTVGRIDTTNIDATYKDPAGNTILNSTITT